MCNKKGNNKPCGCCEYQGWTNSATWSVAYLIMQERPIYEKLVSIVRKRPVTSNDINEVWNTMKHESKDKWTKGKINFQEIANTHFNNEDYDADWQLKSERGDAMKTQHTPGPWFVNDNYIEDESGTIAKIMRPEANATLIAAAPELLEALENLLDWADNQCGCSGNDECHGWHNDEELTIARAAIAKSRGYKL